MPTGFRTAIWQSVLGEEWGEAAVLAVSRGFRHYFIGVFVKRSPTIVSIRGSPFSYRGPGGGGGQTISTHVGNFCSQISTLALDEAGCNPVSFPSSTHCLKNRRGLNYEDAPLKSKNPSGCPWPGSAN